MGSNLSIEKIELSNPHTLVPLDTEVTATIKVGEKEPGLSYAWYLYLDDTIIERTKYSTKNNTTRFKFSESGQYRIKGYVKNRRGVKVSLYSETVKVYPQRKYVKQKRELEYKRVELDFSELSNLPLNEKEATIYSVSKDYQTYEYLVKPIVKSPRLIIMASGAYDAEKSQLPNLQRHSWMNEIEGNVIYFNDPTLYLEKINLGWGQRTEKDFYLKNIAEMITIFAKKMNINQEHILFYGSSAGGYMSLVLAGYIEKTSVLINNPQTIVPNYFAGAVTKMYDASYKGLSKEEIAKKFKNRLDIRAFYSKVERIPNIYYLQNTACESDMTRHYQPFQDFISSVRNEKMVNNFIAHLYSDEVAQHNPLDKKTTLEYINKVSRMWID